MAAGFEQRELAAAVDLQVGERVAHRVDVADLAGQVEDHGLVVDQSLHRKDVADIDRADGQARVVLDWLDVEPVAAGIRDERVDDQHLRAQGEQPHAPGSSQ